MQSLSAPANLIELLRAAVAMGETPNLSQAAKRVGLTRPTLRRHLQTLDNACNEPLFALRGQSYGPTVFGEKFLPAARRMLDESERLVSPDFSNLAGLRYSAIKIGDGWFRTQQHKLNAIWKIAPQALRDCFDEWTAARGDIDATALTARRKQLVVLRQHQERWICVHIGMASAMAEWLGRDAAKSAVGRPIEQSAMSNDANRLLLEPLDHVTIFGGAWYDHVSARFPRPGGGLADPVTYQRLVLSCSFPDGSPAVATFVVVTDDISLTEDVVAAG